MSLYLGLDLGTSGCRAVVIDAARQIQAFAEQAFPAPERQGKHVEQAPSIWWHTVMQVLTDVCQRIDARRITALAVDGTSATAFLIDADGQPVSTALLYNDARAETQAAHINRVAARHGEDAGATAAPTSSLAKLLWFNEHHPGASGFRITHQADWIAGQLCGHFGCSDANNCLKLGWDATRQDWPQWFAELPVPAAMLPTVLAPGSIMGLIRPALAAELGLAPDTQVVAGTTDSTAAVIATGASAPGEAISTLGSTLVLKIIADRPFSAVQYGVYSQPLFNHWLAGGASNSGGAVLRHFFSLEQIRQLSTQLRPEQDTGLDYYPLLAPGERFPVCDSNYAARLSPRPDDDRVFFQALLEGIAKIEKMGYDRLAELGAPYPSRVISMGGGAKNTAWCQMRERILGVPVTAAAINDSAYGSALLASSGH